MTMTSLSSSSQEKIREKKKKGAYVEAPTFATTLKLLFLLRSCCHHIEAPFVGAFLKLPTLETPMDFRAPQALSYSSSL